MGTRETVTIVLQERDFAGGYGVVVFVLRSEGRALEEDIRKGLCSAGSIMVHGE